MTQPGHRGQSAPTDSDFGDDTGADSTSELDADFTAEHRSHRSDSLAWDASPTSAFGRDSDAISGGNGSLDGSTGSSAAPWVSAAPPAPPSAAASSVGAWSAPALSTADAPTGTVPVVAPHTTTTAGPQEAARPAPRSGREGRPSRGPRRARLQLRHIDPWTVLKFSSVLSIALFFVWLIVVGVLYGVLDGAGVIDKINDAVTTLQAGGAEPPVRASIVFGGAAIIGVVNIVLFIALSTVGSVVYNLCADLVGGIEVTLSER